MPPEALAQVLLDAFQLGDVLPTERLVRALVHLRDAVAQLHGERLPGSDRKARRKLRRVQEALQHEPAGAPSQSREALAQDPEEFEEEAAIQPPEDPLLSKVQALTRGKRALFISNRDDPDVVSRIRDAFQLEELEHSLPSPRRIEGQARRVGNQSYDFVLAATGFLPHTIDVRLKRVCTSAAVPYVRVNRGRPLACTKHLARELGLSP